MYTLADSTAVERLNLSNLADISMTRLSNPLTPAPIRFAYWVPNVSGGLVISKIEQRTSWDADYNRRLAQIAEETSLSLTETVSIVLGLHARGIVEIAETPRRSRTVATSAG